MKLCGFQFRPIFALLVLGSALVLGIFVFYSGTRTLQFVKMPYFTKKRDIATKQTSKAKNVRLSKDLQYTEKHPLLTLFTTFKNSKSRWQIHWNVLKNWATFHPRIRTILFNDGTDAGLVAFAKEQNWTVLPVPARSRHGTPQLKDMFFASQKLAPKSVFFGYANGDLLFDDGLGKTLEVVARYLDQLKRALVIGMRTNVNIKARQVKTIDTVLNLAKYEGKLFRADAEDYFLIAHNEFPWNVVPNLVIGRPAYDNFLVATAVKHAVSVVDATKTLIALHQTGTDGNFAGHRNKDSSYNSNVIGRFNYNRGLTTSAQYVTQYNARGQVEILKKARKGQPLQMLTPSLTTTTTTTTTTAAATATTALLNTKIQKLAKSTGLLNQPENTTTSSPNQTMTSSQNLTKANMTAGIQELNNQTKQLPPLPRDVKNLNLLTLFTVFAPSTTMRQMHLNVLKNWAYFHPKVKTVLFSSSKDGALAATAQTLNWTVLPVTQKAGQIVPPVKQMFLQVKKKFPDSLFYGYIPCELLFDEGLEGTVQVVAQYLQQLDRSLVVGSRSGYPVEDGYVLADPEEVGGLIKAKEELFRVDHDNNFLIGHSEFPWQHIPDIVMGRPAYDNYIVAMAVRHEFAVVDATQTLLALQQVPTDPELISNEAEDFDPNLLGQDVYAEGFVASAQYETRYDPGGAVELWMRPIDGTQPVLLSPSTGGFRNNANTIRALGTKPTPAARPSVTRVGEHG